MNKTATAAILLTVFGAATALAGPIEDRQAVMMQFVSANRTLGGLAKGTTPFDAAAAKTQLEVLVDGAGKLPGLFPAGTDTGSATKAKSTIWSDQAGFKAAAAKLGSDAKAAESATDTATFAVAFKTVSGNCEACHGAYSTLPPRPPAP